jgi:hypothetical protein
MESAEKVVHNINYLRFNMLDATLIRPFHAFECYWISKVVSDYGTVRNYRVTTLSLLLHA